MRIPRLVLVMSVLIWAVGMSGRAAADPFVFTGSVTGSFNGGPFTSAGNFHGILFEGFSFTAESDVFQRLFFSGPLVPVGRLERTATNTVVNGDELQLRMLFTSANNVTPNPLSFDLVFRTSPDVPGVIAVNIQQFVGAPAFTFDGGAGYASLAAGNLRFPGEVSQILGTITLTGLNGPASTPEPGTLLLLAGGMAAVGRRWFARYRRAGGC